jgi:hypothetical protein
VTASTSWTRSTRSTDSPSSVDVVCCASVRAKLDARRFVAASGGHRACDGGTRRALVADTRHGVLFLVVSRRKLVTQETEQLSVGGKTQRALERAALDARRALVDEVGDELLQEVADECSRHAVEVRSAGRTRADVGEISDS